jgi:hypothetical protein
MGALDNKLDYLKGLAMLNLLIAHGQPVEEDSEENRVSFISVEDEELQLKQVFISHVWLFWT